MGHNLNYNKEGKANMMYIGETPWHKQGTYLGELPITAEEAIKVAGMDWQVIEKPIYTFENPDLIEIDNYKAIIREDTEDVLGIARNRYKPFQNSEAFKILDPFIGINQAVWHTAGVLGKGERIWALAKLPGNIKVTDNDIIDKYLMLTNSHNGFSTIQLRFTPIRVVCQNTLNTALIGEGSQIIKVKHTKNSDEKIKEGLVMLGLVENVAKEFENIAKDMYKFRMTDEQIDTYLADILEISKDARGKVELYKEKSFLRYRDLVEGGIGTDIDNVKGSLWGVYNAVTEGVDHTERKVKDKLNYIWFGSGINIKDRAWNNAKKLLKRG